MLEIYVHKYIYDFDLGIMSYPQTQKKPAYLPHLTILYQILTIITKYRG